MFFFIQVNILIKNFIIIERIIHSKININIITYIFDFFNFFN